MIAIGMVSGCAGNDSTIPPIPGEPMTLNLTPSEISGNADPTVIDISTLREILVLNPNGGGRTGIRAQYNGRDPAVKRDVQISLPLEEELREGQEIKWVWTNSPPQYWIALQEFTNDEEEAEVGDWIRGSGTFTVTRKVGRVVTIAIDATLIGSGAFSTGTVRLRGEMVLDFSSPLWEDLGA